ncbi:HORMA-1 domain-containing protein [Stigmatella ashevillensis]|uniref:HORMA-1 domain-containing protein n=1 Tax=Stigmatella ashevillensis TaxID=2995309 RepID=UPI00358DC0EC
MKSVMDDLMGCAVSGFLSTEEAQRWYSDLTYLLTQQAISIFELQLTLPDGSEVGFEYKVSNDGSLFESSSSGGQRLHLLPRETKANLWVRYHDDVGSYVREEMRRRGWGPGGGSLTGGAVRERAYSKDNYGLIRSRVGDW